MSRYFANTGLPSTIVNIIGLFAVVCAYGLSFIVDASSMENKYKNIYIIIVVLWGMYNCLRAYFMVDDASNWNPFKQYDFQYPTINFKSVFISPNLCLFMLNQYLMKLITQLEDVFTTRKLQEKY